jgi:hypothetical protein
MACSAVVNWSSVPFYVRLAAHGRLRYRLETIKIVPSGNKTKIGGQGMKNIFRPIIFGGVILLFASLAWAQEEVSAALA